MENHEYASFYNKLKKLEGKELIENYLVYNISTVLSKVKPSITLTIHKKDNTLLENWNQYGKSFIKEVGLEYIELRNCARVLVLLIYNNEVIKNCIKVTENKEFLTSIGYPKSNDPYLNLFILKKRYSIYNCPHEIGIFLGIPISDVKDFIHCGEKKCIMCKYWKVYNNHQEAEKIFHIYDRVRDHTVKNLLMGNNTIDVATNLKKLVLTC